MFTTRQDLIQSLNLGVFNRAAEIGVRYGWFSKFMLDNTEMEVWSVDPWLPNAELDGDTEQVFEHAKRLLAEHGKRSHIIRGWSPAEAENFDDNFFDFIYIDAAHDYESVKADLGGWYGKLRSKGIFAGHDYDEQAWPGVFRAVNEFFEERKITLHLTGTGDNHGETDGGRQSFWGIKP